MLKQLGVLACTLSVLSFGSSDTNSVVELLQGAKGSKKAPVKAYTDPFQSFFNTAAKSETNLPFEQRTWIQGFLTDDFENTAHQWSMVKEKLSDSFAPAAKGAYLYSLWKMNLPQTFVNEWLNSFSSSSFASSHASRALEESLNENFDQWILTHTPSLRPEVLSILANIPVERSPMFQTLKGWVAMRKGTSSRATLTKLPEDHRLRPLIAQSVALQYAKENNLVEAGRVLRDYGTPNGEGKEKAEAYARYNLQLARILYQAGALPQAEEFYEKIPAGSQAYIDARDELTWTWLRQRKFEKLRGTATTLSSKIFDERFSPETYVVMAISNLKMCFYNKTASTLKEFIDVHEKWAKSIDSALKSSDPVKPGRSDFFVTLAEASLKAREQEAKALEAVAARSIKAALPAVGVQAHWTHAMKLVSHDVEEAKKQKASEYHRVWSNQQAQLKEAIRKMRFVKVELMTQMQRYAQIEKFAAEDQTKTAKLSDVDKQIYPFDGVLWPDELFALESLAETKCLKKETL